MDVILLLIITIIVKYIYIP